MAQQQFQLPLLPGYTFEGPKSGRYPIASSFDIKGGFVTIKPPGVGISPQVTEDELAELAASTAKLTYRPQRDTVASQLAATSTVPAHEAFDKQVMTFDAWFLQIAPEDKIKQYIRQVKIFYYLEDDTISIIEPSVENSGLLQGKFLKRQRIPKDTAGALYGWRDLNVGTTVTFFWHPLQYPQLQCVHQKLLRVQRGGVELGRGARRPDGRVPQGPGDY